MSGTQGTGYVVWSVAAFAFSKCFIHFHYFVSLSLLSVDEKTKSHPPDFSPSVGNEGGPPAYAAETNQPAGIVYVQAPREVRLRSFHFGREVLMHVAYNCVYISFVLSCL